MEYKNTALVLDNDLGCLFAVCTALFEFGYAAIPSHTVLEARTLLEELAVTIDLVIVNSELAGVESLVLQLERQNPNLVVFQLEGESPRNPKLLEARTSATLKKYELTGNAAVGYWVQQLRKALA